MIVEINQRSDLLDLFFSPISESKKGKKKDIAFTKIIKITRWYCLKENLLPVY